ncbi:MAG: Fe-S cluster assembly ATPase SufC [Eubacteriales bacterium]|nr:Fe-S cluster assembly ATPase SufC [Eubacteriales bacterium]
MEQLLAVRNLYAGIEGKQILKGIDLTINKGEIHVLMGPNGAGKSTLMNLVMNHPKFVREQGDIIFEDENINELTVDERARRGIFMSFQNPFEVAGVSLENFIRTAYMAVTQTKPSLLKFKKQLMQQMEELKIPTDYADRYINVGFSGGEKKKAEILQMSMLNPKLAMLDETDSGLDVDAVRVVSEGVRKYHNEENSVLLITHHKEILKSLKPDFVHVLIDGKIALTGGAELIDRIEEDGYTWIQEA